MKFIIILLSLNITFSTNFAFAQWSGVLFNSVALSQTIFSDPMVRESWYFRSSEYSGISVLDAYAYLQNLPAPPTHSKPVIVAILDHGVDVLHEDLKNNIWTNTLEIPNNHRDDDHNGYIDDLHGINTADRDPNGLATTDLTDYAQHGTPIAGIIGAQQNNQIGIAGIASHVQLMILKVLPLKGEEKDADVAEAMIYAAKHGAKIINCSFGKYIPDGGELLPKTMDHLAKVYGVIFVASAGNKGDNNDKKPRYPANYENENLIVVTGTEINGTLNPFLNYGPKSVDLAAPSRNIWTTFPNNTYNYFTGTSAAAPMVSGVLAEVLFRYPYLTTKNLMALMYQSLNRNSLYKNKIKYEGRIDLLRFLQKAGE